MGRPLRLVALAMAMALHAAVLWAVVHAPVEPLGEGGVELDAINVEIVAAAALESRAAAADPTATVAAEVSDAAGAEAAPQQVAAPSRTHASEKSETDAAEQPRKTASEIAVEPVAAVGEQQREAEPVAPPREPRPRQEAAPSAATRVIAATPGGAEARGADLEAKPATAAAAASPGVARAYAKGVLAALSRSKPKPGGGLGTVRLAFAVGEGGEVRDLRVTKSSGLQVLDAAALDAVRRAKLPVPPAGMSLGQLSYEIPYHFR